MSFRWTVVTILTVVALSGCNADIKANLSTAPTPASSSPDSTEDIDKKPVTVKPQVFPPTPVPVPAPTPVPAANVEPPTDAPTNLSAVPTLNDITLTWDSMGSAAAYLLEKSSLIQGDCGTFTTIYTGPANSLTDQGLPVDTRYCYRVSGSNAGGQGPTSDALKTGTLPIPNIPPVLAVSTGIAINEGDSSILITNAMLAATDADQPNAEIIFTLTEAPSEGEFLRSGNPVRLGDSFTQDDIDQGRITYNHKLRSHPHTFKLSVRDTHGDGSDVASFAVAVTKFCVGTPLTQAPFAAGNGTANNPFIICTRAQFNAIGTAAGNINKHYRLYDELDYAGNTFTRVGSSSAIFVGTFDGRGYAIKNVTFGVASANYNALFANIGVAGVLQNMVIESATITGRQFVSILAGLNNGTIRNASVHGTISLTDAGAVNRYIGGIAGQSAGTITDSSADITINIASTATTPMIIGGLVGRHTAGVIQSSHSSGTITGTSLTGLAPTADDACIGGLVGSTYALVTDSHSSVSIVATGNGTNIRGIGGFVGFSWHGSTITRSYATGNVHSELNVGGFAGNIEGFVDRSYATGDVTSSAAGNPTAIEAAAGGFVGRLGMFYRIGLVSRSYATGDVHSTTTNATGFGGFAGTNYGSIENVYSSGHVDVGTQSQAGALVGRNTAESVVDRSFSFGSVTATGGALGGLIGANAGTVTRSAWNKDTNPIPQTCGMGVCDNDAGKTSEQLKNKTTFLDLGFDFWEIDAELDTNGVHDDWMTQEDGYPILTWQTRPQDVDPPRKSYSFAGGTGTQADPFLIATPIQLAQISRRTDLTDKSYRLVADLDMTGIHFEPIGHTSAPYVGHFDGGNFKISNLNVTRKTSLSGLFGLARSGAKFNNIRIINPTYSVGNGAGGLAGALWGQGSNASITVSNTVISGGTLNGLGSYIAGLAGGLYFTTVEDSGTDVDITLSSSPNKCNFAGGFAGLLSNSYIRRAYARGDVTTLGGSNGGFYGWGEVSTVEDSYATGNVSGARVNVAFPENACVTVTSWAMLGGFAGVAYTGLGPIKMERVYASGTVTSALGTSVGGLVGMAGIGATYSVFNSFAVGTVNNAIGRGLIGNPYQYAAQDLGSYFASTGGTGKAVASCTTLPDCGVNGIDISVATGNPSYFYNKNNPPLSTWDFNGVWLERATSHPQLQWEGN